MLMYLVNINQIKINFKIILVFVYYTYRCVYSLRLNSDRDFKHLISYGREFQYFGANTEKADSE